MIYLFRESLILGSVRLAFEIGWWPKRFRESLASHGHYARQMGDHFVATVYVIIGGLDIGVRAAKRIA